MKKILFSLIGLVLIGNAVAQTSTSNPDKFVQFYVASLENREKAAELNEFLKSKDGIKISRTDISGKTCYVIFEGDYNYSEKEFEQWLTEKGYTLSCFHEGTTGKDSFKKINPEDCGNK